MGIDRLASGSYRYRYYYKGKTYSKVFDHEPLQKELREAEKEFLHGKKDLPNISFADAYKAFIAVKKPTLSPTTIRGYQVTYRRLPPRFTVRKISSIDSNLIQTEVINELITHKDKKGKAYSYKTIKNTADLVRDVIRYKNKDFEYDVTLPQKSAKDIYVPTDEEVAVLTASAKGTRYEVPIGLACFGMRRGEICALTADDVTEDGTVSITKSLAVDEDNAPVIKLPKNDTSIREIDVTSDLAKLIKKQGYVYNGSVSGLEKFITKVLRDNKMTHFSVHALRHYFCSKCIDMGIDILTIQKIGGWKTPYTPMRVYAKVMREKEKRQRIVNEFAKIIS